MKKAVAYYRVSTEDQGESGLGLEAQRYAVLLFLEHNNYELVGEFVDIMSGKIARRPSLLQAIKLCKAHKATLLIARQNRLARNAAFICDLCDDKQIEFISVDAPDADEFVIKIKAVCDEQERRNISIQTKAALQVAKTNGVILGIYGREVLSKKNKENADAFARNCYPLIRQLLDKGLTIRKIVSELNRRRVVSTYRRTNTGGKRIKWHLATVHGVIKRARRIENKTDGVEHTL
ncbi:recombinase family protein [Filimonas effusa]|uniref:Recombinase family protein n=1 Tax=Filimonas effusa TaxID=2508721 RepID=A0A4Q1D5Y7_9BACT|nr:recombinase family protein [Filimonas effusa]RXK83925.1 recombinase family protein [Filimonas effusa]